MFSTTRYHEVRRYFLSCSRHEAAALVSTICAAPNSPKFLSRIVDNPVLRGKSGFARLGRRISVRAHQKNRVRFSYASAGEWDSWVSALITHSVLDTRLENSTAEQDTGDNRHANQLDEHEDKQATNLVSGNYENCTQAPFRN